MRASKTERLHAEQFSISVDRLIADPDARLEGLEQGDLETAEIARQFARLPSLLKTVDPAFENRVMQQVEDRLEPNRRRPALKLGWAFAGLAVVLLMAMLLTPWGQTAVATFMSALNLGRTEVRITPVNTPSLPLDSTASVQGSVQRIMSLEEAKTVLPFSLPQPAYLPSGYRLSEVVGHTYPSLPAWVPQPFFAELVYEDGQGREIILQVNPIMLGDGASISRLNLKAAPIEDVRNVEVNGQPAVLLRLGGKDAGSGLRQVVWETDELVMALSAVHLSEDELLRMASQVQ